MAYAWCKESLTLIRKQKPTFFTMAYAWCKESLSLDKEPFTWGLHTHTLKKAIHMALAMILWASIVRSSSTLTATSRMHNSSEALHQQCKHMQIEDQDEDEDGLAQGH